MRYAAALSESEVISCALARSAHGESALRDCVLDHSCAKEVAGALRKDVALHGARLVAHAAREIAEAQAKARAIEIVRHGAREHGFELADPRVLFARVAEIFPRRMPGAESLRGLHREPFVDQMLAKRRAASGFPIGVVVAWLPRRADACRCGFAATYSARSARFRARATSE